MSDRTAGGKVITATFCRKWGEPPEVMWKVRTDGGEVSCATCANRKTHSCLVVPDPEEVGLDLKETAKDCRRYVVKENTP